MPIIYQLHDLGQVFNFEAKVSPSIIYGLVILTDNDNENHSWFYQIINNTNFYQVASKRKARKKQKRRVAWCLGFL